MTVLAKPVANRFNFPLYNSALAPRSVKLLSTTRALSSSTWLPFTSLPPHET
jgi:hypothetical protein